MKKIIATLIFTAGLFCSTETPTAPASPTIPQEPCRLSVVYSRCIRESSFEGVRDGITFKTDTLPGGTFNGVMGTPTTNCDSLRQFWAAYIGGTFYDTTTGYYGPATARWLDTFYFRYEVDAIE